MRATPLDLLIAFLTSCFLASAAPPQQAEKLGRGLVGVHQPNGKVFLSWRLLATDPVGVGFNLYRFSTGRPPSTVWSPRLRSGRLPGAFIETRLNSQVLTGATWFVDSSADLGWETSYRVRPVIDGVEQEPSAPFRIPPNQPPLPYLTISLKTVGGYTPGDASVGDLDGDGEYELVVMQNGRARDNSQAGTTDPALLQAYELDGAFLWEINLGKNIRAGAHYSPFIVYDLDGDGRSEVVCKTADGTTDGEGKVIGDATANHVNAQGHVLRGPEFLTVFDGETGVALATADYIPSRHPSKQDPSPEELKEVWGDDYGNRSERYLACVAYLDGTRPSLVMCRGYYTRAVLAAWDFRENKLTSRWVFDTEKTDANKKYRGEGNHNLSVADVDGDQRHEIIYGAAVIDDDGTGLYATSWGHGDALHVSDLDPTNPGLEVFSIQERFAGEGMNIRDARTGRPLFVVQSTEKGARGEAEGPGRGASFNIDPRHPGHECWAFGAGMRGLYNIKGERISNRSPRSCNFAVWWDGDLLRELLDRNQVSKWDREREMETPLLIAQGQAAVNGSKATPVLSGDLLGDWREEIIWKTTDNKELRIYITTLPTEHRLVTLMHDIQYRVSVAWQNAGYNQPPHASYFLDEAAPLPARPSIYTVPKEPIRH